MSDVKMVLKMLQCWLTEMKAHSEKMNRWSVPLEAAGVESDLDGDGAARIQMAAMNGDSRSSGDRTVWRQHTREVRWLDMSVWNEITLAGKNLLNFIHSVCNTPNTQH